MLLGVPMADDRVLFNSAKIYGPVQMPHLIANWDQVQRANFYFLPLLSHVFFVLFHQIHTEVSIAADGTRVNWPKHLKEEKNDDIWSYQPIHILERKFVATKSEL